MSAIIVCSSLMHCAILCCAKPCYVPPAMILQRATRCPLAWSAGGTWLTALLGSHMYPLVFPAFFRDSRGRRVGRVAGGEADFSPHGHVQMLLLLSRGTGGVAQRGIGSSQGAASRRMVLGCVLRDDTPWHAYVAPWKLCHAAPERENSIASSLSAA